VLGEEQQQVVLRFAPTVRVIDISMTGALLSSLQSFPVGHRTELRTTLGGEPFVVEVQIQRVTPEPKGGRAESSGNVHLGVSFVSLDDHNLRCIQQFLKQKPA
jgi:hypothetical protein